MSTIAKWTWPHSHEEINKYILTKENDQGDLIILLEEIGVEVSKDEDAPGNKVLLKEIDPFTFYRHIYKHGSKNRLKYLQAICEKLELKEIPNDTNGIPSVQAMKTWFFPYEYEREGHEISLLWKLFKQSIKNSVDSDTFESAREIPSIGPANITEALFMVNPYEYIPINGPMKKYCEQLKIDYDYNGFEEYEDVVAKIRRKLGADLIQISYDASSTRKKKYWLYAPGERAVKWDEFYKSNVIALGWDQLGDLKQYKTKEQIGDILIENRVENDKSSKTNNRLANFEFCNVMKPGDIVFCKNGLNIIVGCGEVTGDYYYDIESDDYKSRRSIDWTHKGVWNVDWDLVNKTLTDITKYKGKKWNTENAKKLSQFSSYGECLQALVDNKFDPFVKTLTNTKIVDLKMPLNQILYGPPGTGKTRRTVELAAQIVDGVKYTDYRDALKSFNKHLNSQGGQVEFVTFHQNYSYEDFVQGLRPVTEDGNGELSFTVSDGVFKKMADEALQNYKDSQVGKSEKRLFDEVLDEIQSELVDSADGVINIPMKRVSYDITDIGNVSISFRKASGGTGHTLSIATLKRYYNKESVETREGGLSIYYRPLVEKMLLAGKADRTKRVELKNYVLIIDEINRANISRVFGELITLIEKDKRFGGEIPLSCKLPSGQVLEVPPNLYIIGTMNTADKSIALLDIALRRRFEFVPMYPHYEIEGVVVNDRLFLENINKAIVKERGKGPDFTIGHSYFITTGNTQYDRLSVFNNKVIPLLMEYFMNDKQKVKDLLTAADNSLNILDDGFILRLSE